ncbi:zinc finger CCHC domain-containing protein 9 [Stigmatopora nigra]
MTRWARANGVHQHKEGNATPWSRLKATRGRAEGSRATSTRPGADSFMRKKKDYTNPDVNGFLEFMKQSGHSSVALQPEDIKREVTVALHKDHRRETRRVKRQTVKKGKMLCFNCRKPGHGLADCPHALEERETGAGICYRCGSAEHDIQRCRAKVDPAVGEYPYAKCFICSQTGHLSRSCPDNPKGLYVQGGGCRICESVEHFQKDCPQRQASAENSALTLDWLSNNMSADHQDVHVPVPTPTQAKPKQSKVVFF